MVPGAAACIDDLRVDALSVVADPQAKAPMVIANVHFDPCGVRVPECITQRFACDPVYFTPYKRSEIPGRAFHIDTKVRRIRACLIGSQFFTERADGPRKVVGNNDGATQPLQCIPALVDGAPALIENSLQRLLCFRTIRDQVGHPVKLQQDRLKTLQ